MYAQILVHLRLKMILPLFRSYCSQLEDFMFLVMLRECLDVINVCTQIA